VSDTFLAFGPQDGQRAHAAILSRKKGA